MTISSMTIQKALFMLFTLGIMSCQNRDSEFVDQNNTIDFSSGTDIFTRGSEVKKTTMQSDPEGYGVLAYRASTNWTTDGLSHAPDFMNRTQVTYTDNKWGYSPLKYWPKGGTLSFFAYYPYGLLSENYTAAGYPQFSYTVPNAPAAQKDILTACAIDKTENDRSVIFDFKHILSRISFRAKTAADYSVPVKITNVNVTYSANAIRSEGVFTYNTNASGDWAVSNERYLSGTFNVYNSDGITLTKTLQSVTNNGSELYLLPQSVQQGDMKLNVRYQIDNGAIQEKVIALFPVSDPYILDKGKHYQVNLTVTLNGAEFDDITVSDYTEEPYFTLTYKERRTTDESSEYIIVGKERVYGDHTIYLKQRPIRQTGDDFKILIGWSLSEGASSPDYYPSQPLAMTKDLTLYAVHLIFAQGNLIAKGTNGAQIGQSTDKGLFFQFGSLLGWSETGTATIAVKPVRYTGPDEWQRQWKGDVSADDPQNGKGDPCRYYLGTPWRLPSSIEWRSMLGGWNMANWSHTYGWAWQAIPMGARHQDSGIFLPVSGMRSKDKGNVDDTSTGYYQTRESNRLFYFSDNLLLPEANTQYTAFGYLVRCVRN